MTNTGTPVALYAIILLTVIRTYLAFQNRDIYERSLFSISAIIHEGQFRRLLTSGFVHLDLPHLLFNMVSLLIFGRFVESELGPISFLFLYLGSIIGGSIASLIFNWRNPGYRAVGASGGVCGVIFASIFVAKGGSIRVFPLPFSFPTWLYAILFILASIYGMGVHLDNVGHDAHLGGATTGMLLLGLIKPYLILQQFGLFLFILVLEAVLLMPQFRNIRFRINTKPKEPDRTRTKFRRKPKPAPEPEPEPAVKMTQSERNELEALLAKAAREGFSQFDEDEKDRFRGLMEKYKNEK